MYTTLKQDQPFYTHMDNISVFTPKCYWLIEFIIMMLQKLKQTFRATVSMSIVFVYIVLQSLTKL